MKNKSIVSFSLKFLSVLLLVIIALVFYKYNLSLRNNLVIINQGSNIWTNVKISAGGENFYFDEITNGESKRLRFYSKSEDGGSFEGVLNKVNYKKSGISYFTPNMSTKDKIILSDDGRINVMPFPEG